MIKGMMNSTDVSGNVQAKQYLRMLISHSQPVLAALLSGTSRERDGLLQGEQIIQDYLCAAFNPFVGNARFPPYIAMHNEAESLELQVLSRDVVQAGSPFNLIGAHYRSSGSSRGRRSAFSTRQETLESMLRQALDAKDLARIEEIKRDLCFFEELWHAVYLEQYFGLFDRKATLNEWAREQASILAITVLQSCPETHEIEEMKAWRSYGAKVIVLPAGLVQALVCHESLNSFVRAVTRGITEALVVEGESLAKLGDFGSACPSKESLSAWNALLRAANSISRNVIEESSLRQDFSLRLLYSTGLVLFNEAMVDFRDKLLQEFPPELGPFSSLHGEERRTVAHLKRMVEVFQSLQFYSHWFGGNCVTTSNQDLQPENGSLYSPSYSGERYRSSITLFWDADQVAPAPIPDLLLLTNRLFWTINGVVTEDLRNRMPRIPLDADLSNRDVSLDVFVGSDCQLEEVDIFRVLGLARDLSRELHEGKPRCFSFVLGSPEWLISELSMVHDLVSDKFSYRLASSTQDPQSYERTLALLRGNSTFLQDENLALFIPYPGRPLEITHVVRVPGEVSSRREILERFTRGKKAVLAVTTYGNGQGEVLHDGEVKGILSVERQWVRVVGYLTFRDKLREGLLDLMPEKPADFLLGRLEPAMRKISEEIGAGAIFVLARDKAADRLLRRSRPLTTVLGSVEGRSLLQLNHQLIYELSRDDGATIISLDSLRVWGRRHLPSFPIEDLEQSWIQNGDLRWDDWVRTLKWGTRHRTALGASRKLRSEGLVIVISADGPINVLRGGRGIAEFGEGRLPALPRSSVLEALTRGRSVDSGGGV